MFRKKGLFRVVFLTIGIISFTFSSVWAEEKLNLRVWIAEPTEEDRNLWDKIGKGFESLNPDIKVAIEYSATRAYVTKVRTGMVSKDMADVIYTFGTTFITQIGSAGMLTPLTKYFDFSRFIEGTIMPWKIEAKPELMNEVLVIPHTAPIFGGIGYNKDILEKYGLSVPTTWEECIVLLNKLREKGENPITSNGKNPSQLAQSNANRLCALMNDEAAMEKLLVYKTISFLDPKVITMLEMWEQESKYFSAGWENYGVEQLSTFLGQGRVVIGSGGPGTINFLKERFPDFRLGLFGPLFLDGNPIKPKGDPQANLAVPIFSKHKEEAIKFIKYVVSNEVQLLKLLTRGDAPVVQSVIESEGAKQYVKDNPLIGWCLQRSKYLRAPMLINWDDNSIKLMEQLGTGVIEIGLGIKTVSRVAEELESMRKGMLETK